MQQAKAEVGTMFHLIRFILCAARLRIKAFCAKIPVIKTVVEGASMSEARVLYCQSCGAMLNVEANRAYIFASTAARRT